MSKSTRSPIQLPLPIDGETVEIPLTQGYTTIVDAVDADLLEYKWHAAKKQSGMYAVRTFKPYIKRRGRRVYLHQRILERVLERELRPGELVDHVDRDSLNNRRSNLRLANKASNSRNSVRRVNNSTGYKGVICVNGRYIARITVDWQQISLGSYDTPEEAHAVYCEAAIKYHGEFARFE